MKDKDPKKDPLSKLGYSEGSGKRNLKDMFRDIKSKSHQKYLKVSAKLKPRKRIEFSDGSIIDAVYPRRIGSIDPEIGFLAGITALSVMSLYADYKIKERQNEPRGRRGTKPRRNHR